MKDNNLIISPTRKEKITLRLIIFIGLLSTCNFFYWFFTPELIESPILFKVLASVIVFDILRIIYIWYHYWNISVPSKVKLQKQFTVDVLTTYFPGEPYEMVTKTLLAIKEMRYPHQTYLCDEANDPFLVKFCKEHGIIHVTRNNRIDAKAGNINNALKQAKGEICLILDPDHVPKVDFLEEVLPYFQDQEIGFVQTPQVYYNVKESYVAEGASQQTFHFYGPMMMCMNSYGTVNAIGANCVFRRKALDSIGGHAPGLSEDMHTAMQLHAKGWKSIYYPKVFTEGLAPASLTAYYKQQLKWSRGTLELLVSVYPKLFKKFSLRQKFHYGLLPFHYLSGIFVFLGFLIPIISLFSASLPWRGNIINFGLIYIPVLVAILSIRLYVQRWVLYKSERGVHLLGGLLFICTWWVLVVGFFYTIIRKKVPYLPTPKDDKELTNFKILIPNIIIALLSLVAIGFGLSIDLTPFTLFMSGFALLNAFFMLYTFVFAYQKPKEIKLNLETKTYSKNFRNQVFVLSNKLVLPIVVLSVILCASIQYHDEYIKWGGASSEINPQNQISYIGVFAPKKDDGLTDLNEVQNIEMSVGQKFDLISLYLAWNKNLESNFPDKLLANIYSKKSLPVITWEPWINTFEENEQTKDQHVYNLIEQGCFDNYIVSFAQKLKKLNRPIFLRFAHEFDNPFYPWYINGEGAATKFKRAWIHTYEIFKEQGANNVVWIWNPWKPEHVVEFYPGKSYVDWIGVNILNYDSLNDDGQSHEFEELYKPFHDQFKDIPRTPVVISEMGSLRKTTKGQENNWLDNALVSIKNNFSEIKSIIYFNSKVDNNWPNEERTNQYLNWSNLPNKMALNMFANKNVPNYVYSTIPNIDAIDSSTIVVNKKIEDVQGINLKIGHNWEKDYHILSRNKLISDFKLMEKLNINTIKYQGNSVYDYNVFNISKKYGIDIAYSFWVPENLDFIKDTTETQLLKSKILKTVRSLKGNNQIVSWHIENDLQLNQSNFYHKPELLYQNKAYLLWLKDLTDSIKEIDTKRFLIADIEISKQSIYHIENLIKCSISIDGFGLMVKEESSTENLFEVLAYLKKVNKQFVVSAIDVSSLKESKILENNVPFFITAWQDKHESNKLVFDGLIDRKGRPKKEYFEALFAFDVLKTPVNSIDAKILKPSKLIYPNSTHTFYAVIYDEKKGWQFASEIDGLKFEWSLIKCDEYGNYLAIKEKGYSDNLELKIPENHNLYRLHLTVIKDNRIATTITKLSTPLLE